MSWIKNIVLVLSILLPVGLAETAFGKEEPAPPPRPAMTTPPETLPRIVIATCAPNDEFIKLAAQTYAQDHPLLRLRITKMPLSEAAAKLARGEVDLMLTASAVPARPANCILELHKIYVAAVNPNNILENISLSRLKKIHLGALTGWQELGGPTQPVKRLGYNENAAEGKLLDLLLNGKPTTDKTFLTSDTGREIAAVIAMDSNAVGIFPLEYRTNGVKILKVDGLLPNLERPGTSKYPLVARFYVATGTKLSDHARKFAAFLQSSEAAKIYLFLSLLNPNPKNGIIK